MRQRHERSCPERHVVSGSRHGLEVLDCRGELTSSELGAPELELKLGTLVIADRLLERPTQQRNRRLGRASLDGPRSGMTKRFQVCGFSGWRCCSRCTPIRSGEARRARRSRAAAKWDSARSASVRLPATADRRSGWQKRTVRPRSTKPASANSSAAVGTLDRSSSASSVGEFQRRVVAEHHGCASQRLRLRAEPGKPGTDSASNLWRRDCAHALGARCGERDLFLFQRASELSEQERISTRRVVAREREPPVHRLRLASPEQLGHRALAQRRRSQQLITPLGKQFVQRPGIAGCRTNRSSRDDHGCGSDSTLARR